jgi:hypothetical protein
LVKISCKKGRGRRGRHQSRDWEEDLEETAELVGKNISNEIKSSPIRDLEWLRGFQEVKVLRFHDNGTEWW